MLVVMLKRIALISSFLVFATAHGQTLNYVTNVRAMVDSNLQEVYVENDPEWQEVSISDATGNALARARIAPGINSVFGHCDSMVSTNPAETLMADAWTHWTDTVVISDPELDGTVGYFTASLRVFGTASFDLTGAYASGDAYSEAHIYGFWDSWIGTSTDGGGSFLVGGWFGDWYSDEDGNVWYTGDELNQPMTEVTLEFIYGQPFLLRMNMEAYFDAQNPNLLEGTVSGTLDFSHTAYWNGIGGIFDADGNPTSPTFWSQSGVDWQNPVPEPATLVALCLGAALIWLRRR
jgi:hypothetical protein